MPRPLSGHQGGAPNSLSGTQRPCLFQAIFRVHLPLNIQHILGPTPPAPAHCHTSVLSLHTRSLSSLSIASLLGPLGAGKALPGAVEGTVLLGSPSRRRGQGGGCAGMFPGFSLASWGLCLQQGKEQQMSSAPLSDPAGLEESQEAALGSAHPL